MSSPVLSVIVVSWNVRDYLRDCLVSLEREASLPPESVEVIVVDNDSADGSAEMVAREFPRVIVQANRENLGFGRANNQAFRTCRGRYVLLLNPDTAVRDRAVDRMLQTMERRPDVGVVGCRLVGADGSFQRWTGGHVPTLPNVICHFLLANKVLPARLLPPPLYLESDPSADLEVGWVSGACMLLRREALGNTIFDERFFLYGEDLQLCDRLSRAGWKVVYTPAASIVHHEGRSFEAAQSPAVKGSKLRGLRQVFALSHGSAACLCYDLVVAAGFLLRSALFALAARARPGHGLEARAARSRRFLGEAVRTLVSRGSDVTPRPSGGEGLP